MSARGQREMQRLDRRRASFRPAPIFRRMRDQRQISRERGRHVSISIVAGGASALPASAAARLASAVLLRGPGRCSALAAFQWQGLVAILVIALIGELRGEPAILAPDALVRHVERFNAMEDEPIVNLVSNSEAASWLRTNIPLFECPDAEVDEIYYFRWWALRKHLRRAPDGSHVFSEFINRAEPISSALGHHLMEGRWLHDARYHDEYVRWWLRSNDGKPHARLHHYSQWLADALYQRFFVTNDRAFLVSVLDELVADYHQWETEKLVPGNATFPDRISPEATAGGRGPGSKGVQPAVPGLFWQFDVRDAMEESISGSRTKKNIRPTINSYMFGNAQAIAAIAGLAGRPALVDEFAVRAADTASARAG